MWTLKEALDFVRELQPIIKHYNYCIAIGGSIINKGESSKDLDLIVHPLLTKFPFDKTFVDTLLVERGYVDRSNRTIDHKNDDKEVWAYFNPDLNKRIDIFFLK